MRLAPDRLYQYRTTQLTRVDWQGQACPILNCTDKGVACPKVQVRGRLQSLILAHAKMAYNSPRKLSTQILYARRTATNQYNPLRSLMLQRFASVNSANRVFIERSGILQAVPDLILSEKSLLVAVACSISDYDSKGRLAPRTKFELGNPSLNSRGTNLIKCRGQ